MICICLIRHGATKANHEHRYLGTTDEPLSKEGRQQLAEKKQSGRYGNPERVFTSPMMRCRETADILFPKAGQIVIPEWTEIDFGAFEGKNYHDLNGNTDYQAWIDSGGRMPFPGGESREDFIERVMQGFRRALSWLDAGSGSEDRELTAVVHGGTIMALCSSLCGGAYFDYQTECGEGYRIIIGNSPKEWEECEAFIPRKSEVWELKKL